MPTYTSGPLMGVDYEPRYPNGVLLVNTETEEVIIYDRSKSPEYSHLITPRPKIEKLERDTGKQKNFTRAWSEHSYDTLTYDESRMGPWSL
jgi:hypothetical protein